MYTTIIYHLIERELKKRQKNAIKCECDKHIYNLHTLNKTNHHNTEDIW